MHPRSHHWHIIDYVLVRQRGLHDIRLTRVMRQTSMWSDHRMVPTTIFLAAKPARRVHRAAPFRKLDVAKLKNEAIRSQLQCRTKANDSNSEKHNFTGEAKNKRIPIYKI